MKITVRQRGKRWAWQFPVWRSGKRTYVCGTERTKEAAQRAATNALAAINDGAPLPRDKRMTLSTFLDDVWLPAAQADLRPSTWHGYGVIFDVRVKPRIGELRMPDLDTGVIEQLKAELLRGGGHKDKGLSPQSVRNTLNALSRALNDAEAWGYVVRNPVRAVRAPKSNGRREMNTWSGAQARAFLEGLEPGPLHTACHLALLTGLRRGEVLGLRWSDVELERGQLSVQRAKVAAGYDVNEGETKSGRARTIALGPTTITVLKAHKLAQLPGSTYVITREDSTEMHPQTLSYYFEEAVRASGLPVIRFHDLRHTHATLLLEAGEPAKVVQERLGHSSVSVTLDVYSHVTEGMQERAAASADAAVFAT
jgi:integrase